MLDAFLPSAPLAFGALLSAEWLNRQATNTDIAAAQAAFGTTPVWTPRIVWEDGGPGFVLQDRILPWMRYRGPTLHLQVAVTLGDSNAFWLVRYGPHVVAGGNNPEGKASFSGTKDLSSLGYTYGETYLLQLELHHPVVTTSTVSMPICFLTGIDPSVSPNAWTALASAADGHQPTAAELNRYRDNTRYFRNLFARTPQSLFPSVIHEQEPYNWDPSFPADTSALYRAGYLFDLHGTTETPMWRGMFQYWSPRMLVAWEINNKVFGEATATGTLRLRVNGSVAATFVNSGPTFTPVFQEIEADLTSLGLTVGQWYSVEVTYEMGAGYAADVYEPHRIDCSVWYVLGAGGTPTAQGYVVPDRWQHGDLARGSTGTPRLERLKQAQEWVNGRAAVWPSSMPAAGQFPAMFRRRRGDVIWYQGTGLRLFWTPPGSSPSPYEGGAAQQALPDAPTFWAWWDLRECPGLDYGQVYGIRADSGQPADLRGAFEDAIE